MLYLWLKYVHIISVIGWVSSTLSLGLYLLYRTLVLDSSEEQEDLRFFYRFLTYFEIGFFIAVLLSGLSMFYTAGYSLETTWLRVKILTAILAFLPLELSNGILVFNYVKGKRWYHLYDLFVVSITPVLLIAGLMVIYMAVFKIV
ncbi:MAG: CopD family protein [Hydrogenothermaceae bacterium]|nr:CopD family protein [Hydrogenothermaceae bacterium]